MSTDRALSPNEAFAPFLYPSFPDPERERLEEESRVRGHAAGYAAGLRDAARQAAAEQAARAEQHSAEARAAAARTDHAVKILNTAAVALTRCAVPVLESVEDALAAASLELAEAVLGYELADTANSARSVVARALDGALPHAVHTVRLNPEDLAVLSGSDAARADVRFVSDPALAPGDAVAEYAHGFLDARISTALARVRSALLGSAS